MEAERALHGLRAILICNERRTHDSRLPTSQVPGHGVGNLESGPQHYHSPVLSRFCVRRDSTTRTSEQADLRSTPRGSCEYHLPLVT